MKVKTITVENSETIERRFRLLNFFNSTLIFLATTCIFLILFLILKDFHYFNSRISIFYPLIHLAFFVLRYILFFVFNSEPLNSEPLRDIKTKKIGKYSKNKIIEICEEIIKENFENNEEIPSIYVVKGIGYNAFVMNSLLLDFIKKYNSITISKELFDDLDIDELKAIIAHEIGHFKRYIPIANRVPFIPFLFCVSIAYISAAYFVPALGFLTFIIYLACFIIIRKIMSYPFKIFRKDVEFLSDLYSANKYGKLNAINALIKLYQMDNMNALLNLEISKSVMQSKYLIINDIEKIKRKIKRKLRGKVYDEKLIKDQAVKYLKKMKFKNKKKLSENEIEKRNKTLEEYIKYVSKQLDNKIINWDDIDNHVKDSKIDSIEYEGFIETLKNNPELQLFRTPDDNIKKMKYDTHPALRERILFMDKNCLSL